MRGLFAIGLAFLFQTSVAFAERGYDSRWDECNPHTFQIYSYEAPHLDEGVLMVWVQCLWESDSSRYEIYRSFQNPFYSGPEDGD